MKLPLVVLSVTAIAAGLTGCTNLKPLQAKVDDLTNQVAQGCCDATNEKLDRMFRKNLEK